jgi:glyoxalase family protein
LGLELVTDDGEDEPLVADAPDVDGQVAIRGMHGVRAYSAYVQRSGSVFGELLRMEPAGDARWLARGERRHGVVIYDAAPAEQGIMGAGTVHHVAFTIRDGEQDTWRSHVAAAGLRPTPVLDRKMFKSVYFREPSGVLLEVATDQPGFVFEPPEHLGESLVLIGDLEHRRAELGRRFPLLPNPRASNQTTERTFA